MSGKELLKLAHEARERAYAPYSNFKVGAALLARDGSVYLGCNIENSSYSPTICAERTAFVKAISEGVRDFEAIAIVGGEKDARLVCYPCGICRQFMSEFCFPDFKLYFADGDRAVEHSLKELLPYSFEL